MPMLRSFTRYPPMSRFSSTLRFGNIQRPSGTREIPLATTSCGVCGSGLPSYNISPLLGFKSPAMQRMSVDLPAPFAPTIETISPVFTVALIPFNALIFP